MMDRKALKEALRGRITSRLEDLFTEIDGEVSRSRQFDLLLSIETNARLLVKVQRQIEGLE